MLRGAAPICSAVLIAVLSAVALNPAQAQSRVNGAEQSDYWSVNTALPSQYTTDRSRTQAKPAAERARTTTGPGDNKRPLSRVPLRDAPGSIGFTAGQSTRSGRFDDGRDVPGLNPNTQQESSYVGLSLSVTSASKGFPVPVPTPFGRPE